MTKIPQNPADALSSLLTEYEGSAYSLSKGIKLSYSAVRQIVTGKTKVTVPTAMRLAKYFGVDAGYWMDLQLKSDIDAASKDKDLQAILKGIAKVKKPAMQAQPSVKTAAKAAAKTTVKAAVKNTAKTAKAALPVKGKKAAKAPAAKPAAGKRKAK